MNVAERDAARAVAVEHPQSAAAGAAAPVQSRKLRPLISLMPYITRYRWRALAALLALLTAAVTTLVVPVAVRRMIDFGFSRESVSLIDSYFAVMIAIDLFGQTTEKSLQDSSDAIKKATSGSTGS